MRRILLLAFVFAGLTAMSAGDVSAQRGDRGDRNSRDDQRRDSGRRDRGNRGWDPTEYLRRADANGNGAMDSGELQGRLEQFVRDLGFDTRKPVKISSIVNRAMGEDGNRSRSQSSTETTRKVVRKVPGFGVETPSEAGGVAANFTSDGQTNNLVALRRKYGEEISNEIVRSMERYDLNGNGKLEANELQRGRWGRPSPADSDLNKDGELSLYELAERYKNRSNSRDRERERGGESNGGDRRDRGRTSGGGSNDSERERARAQARAAAQAALAKQQEEKKLKEERRNGSRRSDSGASNDRARAREAAAAAMRNRNSGGSSSSSREPTANFASSSDRFEKFAKGLMRRYDSNKDGELDSEEIKKYRRPPEGLDANNDKVVTEDELADALARQAEKASDDSKRSSDSKSRTRSERDRSSGSRSSSGSFSFSRNDTNGDGNIQMHEFVSDPSKWTMEKIKEFQSLDKNNDGILTSAEYRSR